MKKRAEMLADYGWNYAMIDVVVAGTAAVATLRDYCSDLGLAIHAHRAMHAAFDRTEKHGITMQFLAKVMRLIGVSQIHTGTAVGKLVGTRAEATLLADILREKHINAVDHMALEQDWGKIKNAFPVSSGGLHPGLVPDVLLLHTNSSSLSAAASAATPKGTQAGARRSCRRSRPEGWGAAQRRRGSHTCEAGEVGIGQ